MLGSVTGKIVVTSIYGRVDDAHATHMMLEELFQNQIQRRGHIVVGGDFDVEAELTAAWIAIRYSNLRVISCGNTCYTKTKSGTEASSADYYMAPAIPAERVEQASSMGATLATHRPVSMMVGMPDRKRKVPGHSDRSGRTTTRYGERFCEDRGSVRKVRGGAKRSDFCHDGARSGG